MPEIEVDTSLTDLCASRDWPKLDAMLKRLGKSGEIAPALASKLIEHVQTLDDRALAALAARAGYLETHAMSALSHFGDVLPDRVRAAPYNLSVLLLPETTISFSPRDHRQIFGIVGDAQEEEVLWFFAHVVFHELTALGYTDTCLRVAKARRNHADEVHWIKLLIRNEGIGNFPFLADLAALRARVPDVTFRYFTYFDWIGSSGHIRASVHSLTLHLQDLKGAAKGHKDAAGLLKRNVVPAINLIGIAMASAIAKADGKAALRDYFSTDPEQFFLRYDEICQQDGTLVSLDRKTWDPALASRHDASKATI